MVGVSLSGEDGPSPVVDEVAEREEGDLLQGHFQQEIDLVHCTHDGESGSEAIWDDRRSQTVTVLIYLSVSWQVIDQLLDRSSQTASRLFSLLSNSHYLTFVCVCL